MSILDRRLSRRELLKGGLVSGLILAQGALVACSDTKKASPSLTQAEREKAEGKPIAPSVIAKPAVASKSVLSEVGRVAGVMLDSGDPVQSETATYFNGIKPLSDIRSSFLPLQINSNLITDGGFADTLLRVVSDNQRRVVLHKPDPQEPPTRIYVATEMELKIGFSNGWLSRSSDEVKALTMYKEFLHAKIWPTLAREFYKSNQGQLTTEGSPTAVEAEDSFLYYGMNAGGPRLSQLFDYSAYLLAMPWAERLLNGTQNQRQGLELTDVPTLLQKAKARNIGLTGLNIDSPEFISTAFAKTSPWVKLIEEHKNLPA